MFPLARGLQAGRVLAPTLSICERFGFTMLFRSSRTASFSQTTRTQNRTSDLAPPSTPNSSSSSSSSSSQQNAYIHPDDFAATSHQSHGHTAAHSALNPLFESLLALPQTLARQAIHMATHVPRKQYPEHVPLTLLQKPLLALGSAVATLVDPERAHTLAALGDVTGSYALNGLRKRMKDHPIGSEILEDRPHLSSQTLDYAHLRTLPETTLGGAYIRWMDRRSFSADSRPPVRFVDDPELAYVMLRYRQIHDFTHVLLGLPTSVFSELIVKWFEFAQTGLPVCLISGVFGPLRLSSAEREAFAKTYFLWAMRSGHEAELLMNCYFERHLEDDLDQVRSRLR
eukprot:CAMPEP_0174239306 /NCGR_PEP_ID=MMETSP0417-20130205/14174_1 /TAXON_ID=242541 /ORGANISM="Mayorella sp, Strain BSH-02190019" /LENGTH=341 /DNA_ID=CAMNT_0015318239 /DNA_START=106 /DNA_END=1127 /DNA_ORIENTATION=+